MKSGHVKLTRNGLSFEVLARSFERIVGHSENGRDSGLARALSRFLLRNPLVLEKCGITDHKLLLGDGLFL